MSSVELAVRRLKELSAVQSRLGKQQREVESLGMSCVESHNFVFGGESGHRGDLVEFEWATYQYASLLHMLSEIVSETLAEFGIELQENRPLEHEVPRLIGLRHCLHHNGLLGVQIAEAEGLSRPVLGVPVEAIRQRGEWGDGKPRFEKYFHAVDSDFLVIPSIVEGSRSKYVSVIDEVKESIRASYEDRELKRVDNSNSLHR